MRSQEQRDFDLGKHESSSAARLSSGAMDIGAKGDALRAWADRASLCVCATPDACTCKSQERFDWRLASMSDEELEEVFQAWLHASTKPQNLGVYRTLLRDRIEEMVQRGHQHDLRRAF